MKCKKILLLAALISMQLTSFAQKAGVIKDNVDVSDFPKVSFVYHNDNPQKLKNTDFELFKDNGRITNFDIASSSQHTSAKVQNTVILWENMAHNGVGQFNFTKQTIENFLQNAQLSNNDNFCIYEFNRRGNDKSVLNTLTNEFTNDKLNLLKAVRDNKLSITHYPEFPNRSDVYTAIREAINILSPLKGAKSIIVFTSGYPMINSGSDSEPQVLILSQQQHVPVYVFQYYYKSGIASATEGFAESSYGVFNSYKDVNNATNDLIALYPQMKQRYLGQDYKITFTSEASRGDNSQPIALKVNGVELVSSYLPPEFSLWIWIEENIILSIILIVLLLCLIGFVIYYFTKTTPSDSSLSTTEGGMTMPNPPSIPTGASPIAPIHTTEHSNHTEIFDDGREMVNWMRVKNINPRLDYRVGHERQIFNISKPMTTIGSAEDNNLTLCYKTVSRHHAEIVFTNNRGFEIIDKGSTNKVIINGQPSVRAVLKSGDKITLGEVVIIFYL